MSETLTILMKLGTIIKVSDKFLFYASHLTLYQDEAELQVLEKDRFSQFLN